MTSKEFKTLKVKDRVYIPDCLHKDKGMFISTEVLEIDRLYKKVKVLLGGSRFLSYRYVRKSLLPLSNVSLMCGVSHEYNFKW